MLNASGVSSSDAAVVGALSREVGTFLDNRAKEADAKKAQADQAERRAKDPQADLSDAQRQALRDQAETLRAQAKSIDEQWGAGGTYRQVTTALLAAASGNASASGSEFAKNMVVNYVQQQGATYVGKLVEEGSLTEGSPLHAALHGIVACAGAAASSQRCASGAAGAAASSLLTGLFGETSPTETAAEREAKRNLIVSLVTGIAATSDIDAATATNAATAAVDNNWLATQQIVQMKKELNAATTLLDQAKVLGKWGYISTKQDVLTTAGIGKGLAEAGINDIKGLAEFLSDPIQGLNGLKQILTSAEARQQFSDSLFTELDEKIARMQTALEVGGNQNAEQLGKDLGNLIWQVGAIATGAGGIAKGGVLLAKAGANVGTKTLDKMSELAKVDGHTANGQIDIAGATPIINPGFPSQGRTRNCVNCAIATDATFAGRPAQALPSSKGQPISVLEKEFGGAFQPMVSKSAIEAALAELGPGARGIVYGGRGAGTEGHVFNAVVDQKGIVKFFDGQTGKPASFTNFKEFRLLITTSVR